ncbi:17128_t:CDS:2 [Cetraspora pellucida]|uniref:17128_t:CDS:1 n=1 Tax=Cetraspora pellucida TaxID=1433469 RepID=A0ACA9KV07_9GLOM|nr:17128_t:CDS:2 [Cetraspora pellucida]
MERQRPGDWICKSCGVNNFAYRTECFECGEKVQNREVKQNQASIESILNSNKIPYTFIDVAADQDQLKYMKRKNGGVNGLPQIFVDGEYKGLTKELEQAVEMREVKEFLGPKAGAGGIYFAESKTVRPPGTNAWRSALLGTI